MIVLLALQEDIEIKQRNVEEIHVHRQENEDTKRRLEKDHHS